MISPAMELVNILGELIHRLQHFVALLTFSSFLMVQINGNLTQTLFFINTQLRKWHLP